MDSKQRIVLLSEELATVELNNAIAEETGVNDEINRVVQAATALESVMYLMDEPHGDIPLTPTPREMSLAAIAVDQAGALMEVPVGDIVASMESFDGSDASAKLIMEELGDKVKKIWKAIVEMMKRLWQWVKDSIGDFVTTTTALDKRADKIIEAVKNKKVKSNGSSIVKDEALRSRLFAARVDGKAIHAEYSKYVEAVETALKAGGLFLSDPSVQKMHEYFETASPNKMDTLTEVRLGEMVVDACKRGATLLFNNSAGDTSGNVEAANDCKVYGSPLFLGNIGYYMQAPVSHRGMRHIRFGRYSGEEGTLSDLRELNDKQIVTCMVSWKIVFGLKGEYDKIEKALHKNVRLMEALEEGAKHTYHRGRVDVTRAYIALCSAVTMFSLSHLIRVSRDVFRLCEYSLDSSEAVSS